MGRHIDSVPVDCRTCDGDDRAAAHLVGELEFADHVDAAADEMLHERHGGIDAGAEHDAIERLVLCRLLGGEARDDASLYGSGTPLRAVQWLKTQQYDGLAYNPQYWGDWIGWNETRAKLRRSWAKFFESWDVLIAPVWMGILNNQLIDRDHPIDIAGLFEAQLELMFSGEPRRRGAT